MSEREINLLGVTGPITVGAKTTINDHGARRLREKGWPVRPGDIVHLTGYVYHDFFERSYNRPELKYQIDLNTKDEYPREWVPENYLNMQHCHITD